MQSRIFLALILFRFCSLSQAFAGEDTLFVDNYLSHTSKQKAHFYIVRENVKKHKKQWHWDESVYRMHGPLHSTYPITCTPLGYPEKDGLYKEFYPNGNVKKGTFYVMGTQQGDFAEYYPNGQLRIKGRIDEHQNTIVYNMLDTAGNDQLKNGNGLVVAYDSTWGCLSYFTVKDSLKSHTFYIDSLSHDTVYTTLHDTDVKLKPIIISDIPFSLAQKYRGQKLYVACLVNEEGRITRTKNKNSIQPQLDHLMMMKVKYVTDFKSPTLRNGKKVKSAVVIPLTI
jgi:antitoxin component YwqK of YwqJK toxin-antitoxin module